MMTLLNHLCLFLYHGKSSENHASIHPTIHLLHDCNSSSPTNHNNLFLVKALQECSHFVDYLSTVSQILLFLTPMKNSQIQFLSLLSISYGLLDSTLISTSHYLLIFSNECILYTKYSLFNYRCFITLSLQTVQLIIDHLF